MEKSTQSIRGKLIQILIDEYWTNHMFDEYYDEITTELQKELDNYFAFKTRVSNLQMFENILIGLIYFNDENDESIEKVISLTVQNIKK